MIPANELRLKGRIRFVSAAAAALLWLAGGMALAADPEFLLEYRAYNDALERGDAAAAQKHAHAAWQAAENERGDDRLTAILAFNFAQQALFADSQRAVAAIRRANDMRELAAESLPAQQLDVYLAYLELMTGKNSRRNAQALREALARVGSDSADRSFELAAISLALAVMDFSAERLREAIESATAAEAAILRADETDTVSLTTVGVIKGAALLLQRPRREERIREAQIEFRRVTRLYPLQEDIESFAPGLAQALAWDFAATSLLQSIGERVDANGQEKVPALFERSRDPDQMCPAIDWASRAAPKYPSDALRKGYVGAVMIGFHIGDDLRVEGARILAEVPAARFGDAVLEAVAGWQAASMENAPPGCRRNRVTRIRFVIN